MTLQSRENNVNGVVKAVMLCCACNRILKRGGLRFPKSPALRATWVNMIMTRSPDYPGKEDLLQEMGLQLCAQHFDPKMLIPKTEGGHDVFALRKGGVPTIFKSIVRRRNSLQPRPLNDHVMDLDSTACGDEDISICYEMIPTTSTDVKVQTSTSDPAHEIMQVEATPNNASVVGGPSTDKIITNNESTVTGTVVLDPVVPSNAEPVSSNDVIPSLQEFMSLLQLKNGRYYEPWRILYNESSVLFTLFDPDCKYLIQSFTVDINLNVSVFYHGQPFTDNGLTQLLGHQLKLDTWTKFKKLVLFLHTVTNEGQHNTMQLKHACKLIRECVENGGKFGCPQKTIKKWKFALNQIEISNGENSSYSAENLQWAINAYSVNRQGYVKIYDSDVLTLPHPASLELFKRQAMEQARRQQTRPKIVAKKPFKPNTSGTENGAPPSQTKNGSPLTIQNGDEIQQISPISLNGNSMIYHTNTTAPRRQNGFATSNDSAVEDIDCEIQEI